ncbi:hypothetical protein [Virgibacillus salexigens]|uniref:Uncharacterized protein n=1 Tax=Virgibacillus massiliensis TaxID=1462526 RepID=A0A024QH00_9BACI|nr:hypothetical protein [Virgibacillus massiliensis]CDQ41789.1 hypothetical protein BN990_04166 [Virgibacillus massiliensis]
MSKFLNDFLITMPTSQRRQLLVLLERKQANGLIRSDDEFKKEMERLIKELDERDGTPTFEAIQQQDRTNSKDYNANLESIAFDLATIFESSNEIERLLGSHHQLTKSSLSEIRKKITDMRTNVKQYQLMLTQDKDVTESIHEEFHSPKWTESKQDLLSVFRKDRFGETRSSIYDAENVGNSIQLAGIQSLDQLKTNYGRKLADIKIRNRIGLQSEETKYPIGNAIDGSANTFWAESVLVEDIITQDIEDIWSHDYHDYPKDGALCELEIMLNGISTVSEVRFDPFASYPLEVVSIHGYENKNRTGQMYELISPNHPTLHQRSQKSVDRMVFQFPSVEISMIRILVRQENYTKENYMIDEDELNETKLWDSLASNEDLIKDYAEEGETIASFDRKNEVSGWNVYLDKLKEWAEIFRQDNLLDAAKKALEIVRIGDYKNPLLLALYALDKTGEKRSVTDERSPDLDKKWKPINKVSYVYGAYDISVFGRKYHRQSIYISEPLPISSNTGKLALSTDEKHHYVSVAPDEVDPKTDKPIINSSKITDIEYYVTDKRNPIPADWKAILPSNHAYVEGELLFGDDNIEPCSELMQGTTVNFSFRFPFISKDTIVIKRNGVPMDQSMYILCDSSMKVGIKNGYYSPTSVYTVDYKPHESAYLVDFLKDAELTPTQFLNDKGETGEYFDKVDQHNDITLTNIPYLHRDFLYNYNNNTGKYTDNKEVLNANSFTYPLIVRVQGEEYKNITDYTINSYDSQRLNENNGKAYAHINNQIIFGHPSDGTQLKNITVDYYYISTSIRLKAILRRNHAGYESVTPALFNYTIKHSSFDQNR